MGHEQISASDALRRDRPSSGRQQTQMPARNIIALGLRTQVA
jgi:hypothetical protein